MWRLSRNYPNLNMGSCITHARRRLTEELTVKRFPHYVFSLFRFSSVDGRSLFHACYISALLPSIQCNRPPSQFLVPHAVFTVNLHQFYIYVIFITFRVLSTNINIKPGIIQCIKLCVYSHIHTVKTQQFVRWYHYVISNTT